MTYGSRPGEHAEHTKRDFTRTAHESSLGYKAGFLKNTWNNTGVFGRSPLNHTFLNCREVKHCEDGSNNSVNKLLTATAALLNQHKEKQDKEKERFQEDRDFEEKKIAWPADKDAYELGEVIGKHEIS